MRILIDLQACQTASRHRGIGRYSLAMAEALTQVAAAHEVSLLLNGAFPDSVEWLRDRFATRVAAERIQVFAAPGPVAEVDPASQWRVRAAESIREAFVASLEPDVLLMSSLFEGFVDDATTSIASSPYHLSAATLYDLIPLIRPAILDSRVAKAWYERKLESLRRADLLLAISEHSRVEALAAAGLAAENVVVVSTAADACFHVRSPPVQTVQELRARYGIAGDYVLYAGGYDSRKNVVHLIAAFAALEPETRRRYSLVLAGSIDERQRRELLRSAERNQLSVADVRFTGYIDDDELALLYNTCTVFVFPSLHEGFGLPVLEAMACGAAVLGSCTTSIPEVIGRADALFDPVDVSATAERLHAVLTDDGFRSDLQRYALERAKAFSWNVTARRTLDALCERHGRKRRTIEEPVVVDVKRAMPLMAFVSPLPPERTGVAYYSAELLVPLLEHYRIELVTDQKGVDLPRARQSSRAVAGLVRCACRQLRPDRLPSRQFSVPSPDVRTTRAASWDRGAARPAPGRCAELDGPVRTFARNLLEMVVRITWLSRTGRRSGCRQGRDDRRLSLQLAGDRQRQWRHRALGACVATGRNVVSNRPRRLAANPAAAPTPRAGATRRGQTIAGHRG